MHLWPQVNILSAYYYLQIVIVLGKISLILYKTLVAAWALLICSENFA